MLNPIIAIFILNCFNLSTVCRPHSNQPKNPPIKPTEITCTESGCKGTYQGPEFTNGVDVAHRFSNTMSDSVGQNLKKLYRMGKYSMIDFTRVSMSTKGMGTGRVVYELSIPFKPVAEKCQAYTSFDHVGGWNHSPALAARKAELNRHLLPGEQLDISDLKTTPEGLQEYWIQWKNKEVQADCQTQQSKH